MRTDGHQLEYGSSPGWKPGRLDFAFTGVFLLFAIVALAIVIPQFTSRSDGDVGRRSRMDIAALNGAIETFKVDNGRYPTSSEGLAALSIAPPGCPNWIGPYVAKPIVADVWGHPLIYRVPGLHNPETFDILSVGPDGKAGTSDDIGNWISTSKKMAGERSALAGRHPFQVCDAAERMEIRGR